MIRDPTGNSEFIDANDQEWDVKGFNSNYPPSQGGFDVKVDADKVDFELATGENVIIDTQNMTQGDVEVLKQEGQIRGWGYQRLSYRPRHSGTVI